MNSHLKWIEITVTAPNSVNSIKHHTKYLGNLDGRDNAGCDTLLGEQKILKKKFKLVYRHSWKILEERLFYRFPEHGNFTAEKLHICREI